MPKYFWVLIWMLIAILTGVCLGGALWNVVPMAWKINKKSRYLIFLSTASNLQSEGNIQGAEFQLKNAIALKPDSYEAYAALGNLLLSRGHTNEALSAFRSALLHRESTDNTITPVQIRKFEWMEISNKVQAISNARTELSRSGHMQYWTEIEMSDRPNRLQGTIPNGCSIFPRKAR